MKLSDEEKKQRQRACALACYYKRVAKDPARVRALSRAYKIKHKKRLAKIQKEKRTDEYRAKERQRYNLNREEILAKKRDRARRKMPCAINALARKKLWAKNNPEKVRTYRRLQAKRQKATDQNFRFRTMLRGRINNALKRAGKARKAGKTMELIGCTMEEFKAYIQEKFLPGMQWNNRGKVWHIDHIIPCAAFDLTNPSHQRRCFHFLNQQPLFSKDNMSKGAKLLTSQFSLL